MKIMDWFDRWGGKYNRYVEVEMKDLVGITFTKVYHDEQKFGDRLVFECAYGQFIFQHNQDCCENVWLESIVGDLEDLVGKPLLVSECEESQYEQASESGTWTFYKFATNNGYVDVRWIGESNGYYSESVSLSFVQLPGVILEEVFDCEIRKV